MSSYFNIDTAQGQIAVGLSLGLGAVIAHRILSSIFNPAPTFKSPEAKPLRGFTPQELAQCDGTDGRPLYMSVKRRVYAVSANFYGPNAPYHVFAAKDCSRNLGKSLVSDTEANLDYSTLSYDHMKTLEDWDEKFQEKYETVGWLVPDEHYFTGAKGLDP